MGVHIAESVAARESSRGHAPRGAARGAPPAEIGFGADPAPFAAKGPAKAIGQHEGDGIAEAPVAVALKCHPLPARKLRAPEDTATGESAPERLSRELRLEHVQIRELSGMMRRLVEESGDLAGAQRLFGNLARRWDAHTEKEEAALAGGDF